MVGVDLTAELEKQINELQVRWNDLERQKRDIAFYEDCIIDKVLMVMKNRVNVQFPYNTQFYSDLFNKESKNYKRNKKFISDTLKEYFCKDVKITGFISQGYDMHGVGVYFTSHHDEYQLIIPVPDRITRYNLYFEQTNSISWDAAQFKLLKKESECSWRTVWSSYDITKCDYFKQTDSSSV